MMATSASQYGSPYTYKEPLPRIKYPPLFSSFKDFTLKYALDSKTLALGTLLIFVSWVVCVAMTLMPFWFELILGPVDGTFGMLQLRPRTVINCGIFYLREDQWDNLAFLDKYSNADVVPRVLAFAQLCAVLGHTLLSGCLAGGVILIIRRFSSPTGVVMLAAAATMAAVAEVLSCVFCLLLVLQSSCDPDDSSCVYEENLAWHMMPMYSQMYRVEPTLTPAVTINWAFYIACIGAIISVLAAVFLWYEALSTGRTLSGIRYTQLQQTLDPYENDINPNSGQRYVYAEPDRYGTGAWGMQPVVGVQYPQYQPQQPQYQPQYQPSAPQAPRPSVGFGPGPTRKGGYSESEYSESRYSESSFSDRPTQKREINL